VNLLNSCVCSNVQSGVDAYGPSLHLRGGRRKEVEAIRADCCSMTSSTRQNPGHRSHGPQRTLSSPANHALRLGVSQRRPRKSRRPPSQDLRRLTSKRVDAISLGRLPSPSKRADSGTLGDRCGRGGVETTDARLETRWAFGGGSISV
jgi:hypothetical protein